MSEPFRLYGAAMADSYTLRRLSANAVRFRLGKQLDWRIDLMLDSTGMHLLSMRSIYVMSADRRTQTIFTIELDEDGHKQFGSMQEPDFDGEYVVRTEVMLKVPHTTEPVNVPLDLRLRDFMSLTEVPFQRPMGTGTAYDMDMRIGDLMPDGDSPQVEKSLERAEMRKRLSEDDYL